MTTPLKTARLRTTRSTAFCCVLDDMRGAHQLGGAAEFGARAGRRDLRHRLAAPHQCAGIGLQRRRRLRSARIRR